MKLETVNKLRNVARCKKLKEKLLETISKLRIKTKDMLLVAKKTERETAGDNFKVKN